jgi:hypothetical protein
MDDAEKLRMIAKEMRGSADVAYGNPATVQITAKTLREYAEELEQIAAVLSGRPVLG